MMFSSRRKTKIVATLGPATSSPRMIGLLITAGVDVFRLNFSHGDNDQKRQLIETIRRIADRRGATVSILADLQGPKIRVGRMQEGGVPLVKGDRLTITTREVIGRPGLVSTVYQALPRDVRPGSRILMDDGLIELRVVSVEEESVHTQVVEGGILKDNKGINLPGVTVSAPSLTAKDRIDLDFALQMDLDFIALSFVRRAEDLSDIREIITSRGKNTAIIAKIEKPEAIRNFRAILEAADGIMVARGDLGVEIPAEKVPIIQKQIISECNRTGKPVITATQMLESMIVHPRPTRAETSDVANAILDGTDAVMLSGETASGRFPVEAVRTMAKIAIDVERVSSPRQILPVASGISDAVALSACTAAETLRAKALVVFTQSGSTAALMAKFRPGLPIIALTPEPAIQRRLTLYRGVRSFPIGRMRDTDEQIDSVERMLLERGFSHGDIVVITMGVPLGSMGSTNLMKVLKLSRREPCRVIEAL